MTKTITPITPTKVVPIKPKADTRKASEKKYGKPVMDLGFCIVPSLLMQAQARLGINPVQFNIIMHLADIWWDAAHRPWPKKQLLAERMGMSEEKVIEIIKISQEPVSLETPSGEEEDSHLGDFIPDDDAPAPAEAASLILLKEQLNEVLSTLTEREAKVLKLRFGLEDGRSRTLEEVGKEFDVTRERIRQIEAKALRKLRHPSRSKKVKDFLD